LRTRFDDYREPISDINVTPFVDVLLVLLIVFMITAPLFSKAIDIQLPQEDLRSSSLKDMRRLIISIHQDGTYFLDDRRHTDQQLWVKIAEWRERNPQQVVFIQADRRVRYEMITGLMVMLKNSGIQQIGLLVEDKT
jgi:biopolymer transport protein ExbD